METELVKFIKQQRKLTRLTQPECARKAGVSLPFLRNLEQGKKSLQMDKVNKVLKIFGAQLGVVLYNESR
jgi:y4mF family transcriptional regulator